MKAFIYDMDGVIVDTEPLHLEAIVYVLNKMGVHDIHVDDLVKYQGTTDLMVYEDLRKTHPFKPTPEQAVKAKDYLFQRLLEEKGIVGPPDGSKPREVLLDMEALKALEALESPLTEEEIRGDN